MKEAVIRKEKIQKLYFDVWPAFAACFNMYKQFGITTILRNYCRQLRLPLSEELLPDLVGGRTLVDRFIVNFIDKADMDGFNLYIFMHELCHWHLHRNLIGTAVTEYKLRQAELEADAFAALVIQFVAPEHYDKIMTFARNNPKLNQSASA